MKRGRVSLAMGRSGERKVGTLRAKGCDLQIGCDAQRAVEVAGCASELDYGAAAMPVEAGIATGAEGWMGSGSGSGSGWQRMRMHSSTRGRGMQVRTTGSVGVVGRSQVRLRRRRIEEGGC